MILIHQKHILRVDARRNPRLLYVFGDNAERRGLGGLARELRGENNAVGIVTKWRPHMKHDAFFRDADPNVPQMIHADMKRVMMMLRSDRFDGLVWPIDGIGTGRARLEQYAPKALVLIERFHDKLQAMSKPAPVQGVIHD